MRTMPTLLPPGSSPMFPGQPWSPDHPMGFRPKFQPPGIRPPPGPPTFDSSAYSHLQANNFLHAGGGQIDIYGNPVQAPPWMPPAPNGAMQPQEGGGGPSWGGLEQGPRFGQGLHHIPPGYSPPPGDAPKPQAGPPPLPGAPFGGLDAFTKANTDSSGALTQGLNPAGNFGRGADPVSPDGAGMGAPPRAWDGGHFPPGQSAIVGDRPSGAPGPNAELVTAMPGGGFTVTPNPKNAGKIPRFATGTDGQTFGGPNDALLNMAGQMMPPTGGPNTALLDTARKMMPPPQVQTPEPEWTVGARESPGFLQSGFNKIMDAKDWMAGPPPGPLMVNGQTLDQLYGPGGTLPPGYPQGTEGTPPPPPKAPMGPMWPTYDDSKNPILDQFGKQFMKGATDYQAPLQPNVTGNPYDQIKPPQKAWTDAQLLTYAAAQNANDKRAGQIASDGITPGFAGMSATLKNPYGTGSSTGFDVAKQPFDPNAMAAAVGNQPALPPGPPQMVPVGNGSFGNVLPKLSPGTSTSPVPDLSGMPAGLSPVAQQQWANNRAINLRTVSGRNAILDNEMGMKGITNAYQREVAMKNLEAGNTGRNEQAIQDRKDQRGLFFAQQHEQWKTAHEKWAAQQEEKKNAIKVNPLPGGGTVTTMGGKRIVPDAEPIHHQGFVPDDPQNPSGNGVHYDGATNKPERGTMDANGVFRKGGEKPIAEKNPVVHTIVREMPDGTKKHYAYDPATNTARAINFTEEQAAPAALKYTRGPNGTMVLAQ